MNSQETFAAMLALTDLATPHAVRAAVGLGLPKLVLEGVDTIEELAARSGGRPRAVRNLVAFLETRGVFTRPASGRVGLTPVGRMLASDRAALNLDPREAAGHLAQAWPGLMHAIRTGSSGYEAVFGRSLWQATAADPALAAGFDRYMAGWAGQWIPTVVAARDWSTAGHVVDVGGGAGRLLCALLAATPSLTGTLVEMEGAAARGRSALREAGLATRGAVVVGSFFDPLPAGHDLYVLAQVIHDWPDADAVRILRNCGDAAGQVVAGQVAAGQPAAGQPTAGKGRVLLIERLVGDPPSPAHLRSDLFMLALFGSGERTLPEFTALCDAAGLDIVATRPIGHDLSFIECMPHPR